MVLTGLDRLVQDPARLQGRRYALLMHGASVTREARPAHLALLGKGLAPVFLMGPEHGLYGVEQDMVTAAGGEDPWTGVATVSLYGDSEASLRPDPAVFRDVDLLVIDLQDIGSRYYTYAATAVWAAQAAASAGCDVWLLDRPNPLGGARIEGNLPLPGFESFVGAFRLPVRHGLTLGEIACLEARRDAEAEAEADGNADSSWGEQLEIWTMTGWRRPMSWGETGLPWIAPSPNMPPLVTAEVYPGGCLIEATEVSEGRGTTRPFQLVGVPHLDPVALSRRLEERPLPGVTFVPTYFRPQFQKHSGAICGGVEVVLEDPATFEPYRVGVEMLAALRDCDPDRFQWRSRPYEFVSDRAAIDLLAGCEDCRRAVDAGDAEALATWLGSWAADEALFRQEVEPILLYPRDSSR